jgi:hypothetical protein
VLAESFPYLEEAAQRFGGTSADQLQQLIDLAKEAGLTVQETANQVDGATAQAASGFDAQLNTAIGNVILRLQDLNREVPDALTDLLVESSEVFSTFAGQGRDAAQSVIDSMYDAYAYAGGPGPQGYGEARVPGLMLGGNLHVTFGGDGPITQAMADSARVEEDFRIGRR